MDYVNIRGFLACVGGFVGTSTVAIALEEELHRRMVQDLLGKKRNSTTCSSATLPQPASMVYNLR